MADFAGDTSDYIEMPADQDFVEFADLSPDQIGGALRVGIEGYPPDGLPSDLDLDSVDWTQVAAVLTSGSLFGSGFGDF